MAILFLFIFLVTLYNIKPRIKGFHKDFMDKEQCDAIKGIFIVFVFIRHVLQYVTKSEYDYNSILDTLGVTINYSLSQLIVVMFLFYSGFGISESIKKKKEPYIRRLPVNRIIPTLINFDIAVCWFVVLNLLLGQHLAIQKILISLTAWDDVGNSNWYIFIIIVCYLFAYISYQLSAAFNKESTPLPLIIQFLLTLALIFTLTHFKTSNWYNTVLSFIAGMFLSTYKEKIFSIFKQHYFKLFAITISLFVLLCLTHKEKFGLKFNMESVLFAFMVVFITMKVKIQNFPLNWLGAHLFPLYIYQRIPMLALYELCGQDFIRNHAYLYISLCFAITILIAYLYKFWQVGPLIKDKKQIIEKMP